MSRLEQIAELEQRYLLPTYNRYPVALEKGKGVYLYDFDGKKYLDFVAGLGVNALGHAHPRIVKTIREQAAKLIHISNLYYNEYQGQLAESCASSPACSALFSPTVEPKQLKVPSSWRGWPATGRGRFQEPSWLG